MSVGYPIVLDLSSRLVVIVGGGAVGSRKARGLLDGGATRVRVVSEEFHQDMPAETERVAGTYQSQHLQGASLVFAATDSSEVNDAVVRDAHKFGALVCRADTDDGNAGDFTTPAMLRHGSLLLTVSSGGSPALSAMIRDRLEQAIDPRWTNMADAMQTLRPMVKSSLAPSRRKEAFRALCSEEALDTLSSKGAHALHNWLRVRFPELKD